MLSVNYKLKFTLYTGLYVYVDKTDIYVDKRHVYRNKDVQV
jgi:hypothetical protein